MNMREIQKMQQRLMKMQEELENTEFTGTAGGGAVTITMNGKYEVTAVKIDPEAFNAEDIAELEVMVLAAVIEEFSKLPGVGVKTAQRLTFFLLRSPADQARRLAEAILRVKESIIYCSRCFNITETDPCITCSNPNRDQEVICVVEEPLDVLAIEKTGAYKGLYHVLHGALSP